MKETIEKGSLVKVKKWGRQYATRPDILKAMFESDLISIEEAIRYAFDDHSNYASYDLQGVHDENVYEVLALYYMENTVFALITRHSMFWSNRYSTYLIGADALELNKEHISKGEAVKKLKELTGRDFIVD